MRITLAAAPAYQRLIAEPLPAVPATPAFLREVFNAFRGGHVPAAFAFDGSLACRCPVCPFTARLLVFQERVECSVCDWEAKGEAWQLARAVRKAMPVVELAMPSIEGAIPSSTTINAGSLATCLITANALATYPIPPRKRLLDRWLCEADLGIVYASRGVGKTWLAMALPCSISQGARLGQWEPGECATSVLYIDGEMPLELTQFRSRGLKLGNGDVTYLHHETLFDSLGSSLNIGEENHRNALTQLIVAHHYKLIVLDNLSCLASGVDENKSDSYEPIKHWLLELRRRKITVILVLHAGRNGLIRGTSKREDDTSWILSLTDAKKDGENGAKFVTRFSKPSRNTGDSLPDLLWHFTTDKGGSVSIHCETAELSEYETFIQHVLEGVEVQGDIADMMGKPKGTVSKWAKKAEKEGRILKRNNKLAAPQQSTKAPDERDDE